MLTIRRGYHGDTAGAMAVCDPETGMHHLFTQILTQSNSLPRPRRVTRDEDWQDSDIASFRSLIETHHE